MQSSTVFINSSLLTLRHSKWRQWFLNKHHFLEAPHKSKSKTMKIVILLILGLCALSLAVPVPNGKSAIIVFNNHTEKILEKCKSIKFTQISQKTLFWYVDTGALLLALNSEKLFTIPKFYSKFLTFLKFLIRFVFSKDERWRGQSLHCHISEAYLLKLYCFAKLVNSCLTGSLTRSIHFYRSKTDV